MSSVTHPSNNQSERRANAGPLCARCGCTEPWGESSWCPKCGYYPVVETAEEDRMGWRAEVAAEASAEEEVEPNLLNCIPGWMWIMVAGSSSIFIASVMARKFFETTSDHQSYWAWTELLVGAGAAFIAHVWAAIVAKKIDDRLNVSDVIVNWMAVWQPTITKLPASVPRLWMFVWGHTAVICSLFIIGGHDTSMFFRQGPVEDTEVLPDVVGAVAAAAKSQSTEEESIEDALHKIGDPEEMLAAEAAKMEDEARKQEAPALPQIFCAVFGLRVDRRGTPTHFLLCGQTRGELQYVGTVSAKSLSRETLRSVTARLAKTNQRRPVVRTIHSGIWVAPKVTMRIEYASLAADGTLLAPRIVSVEPEEWETKQSDIDALEKATQIPDPSALLNLF
ncbi:MAG: hypothetical protein KDA91_23065 [Planctomycetaceae bacterium]|nr:hypothetical protein [Planctomycetaceae bacterium]